MRTLALLAALLLLGCSGASSGSRTQTTPTETETATETEGRACEASSDSKPRKVLELEGQYG